jgi:membrane protein
MGSATAFFAFFALPAINIILNQILSIIFSTNDRAISGKLFGELSQVFGYRSAHQIENISDNLQDIPAHPLFNIFGFIFLVLSATTLFGVIKSSLNQLWNIKKKAKGSRNRFLKDRAVGLAIIVSTGLLWIVSLLTDVILSKLKAQLIPLSPNIQEGMIGSLNHISSLAIFVLWFALLFAYLPDIKVERKAIFIGAFVTGLLYKMGAYILEFLLIHGQVGVIFGASSSIVLILLFVFYSSLIFYFGAAFTKTYAHYARLSSYPASNATAYQITEI